MTVGLTVGLDGVLDGGTGMLLPADLALEEDIGGGTGMLLPADLALKEDISGGTGILLPADLALEEDIVGGTGMLLPTAFFLIVDTDGGTLFFPAPVDLGAEPCWGTRGSPAAVDPEEDGGTDVASFFVIFTSGDSLAPDGRRGGDIGGCMGTWGSPVVVDSREDAADTTGVSSSFMSFNSVDSSAPDRGDQYFALCHNKCGLQIRSEKHQAANQRNSNSFCYHGCAVTVKHSQYRSMIGHKGSRSIHPVMLARQIRIL